MSKRPRLALIEGGLADRQRGIYRLRQGRAQGVPAEDAWPPDGEWRKLIRRLMKNPVKGV
jgi:hypothetical protein